MEQKIYNIIVEEHQPSWKSMIMDLVSAGRIDCWDVDVGLLSKMYLERIRQMHEAELQISGTMLLAAAFLLKMKSTRLVGEDLNEFDRLLAQSDLSEEELYAPFEQPRQQQEQHQLLPRTPQARTRKVTIFDLVRALEKALETKHRRLIRIGSPEAEAFLPHKPVDLQLAMKLVYKRIREHASMYRSKTMNWSQLLPSEDRHARIATFIPLLHLSTQRKIDLEQDAPLSDFRILLP
jgi:chromatin segregation and condensation protein Rec8/ScpA/Scc1 (kleisin family)